MINEWLQSSKVVRVAYPNVAKGIAEWIAAGAKAPIEELSQDLWQHVLPSNGVYFCKHDVIPMTA